MLILNNQTINEQFFPGGECHIRLDSQLVQPNNVIIAHLHSSSDIMMLFMLIDAIRRVSKSAYISLIIPYMPYARQDRVCNIGEAFGIKIMSELINQLNCDVTIYDPHSDVTPALLNNCTVVTLSDLIHRSQLLDMIDSSHLTFVAPDAGAEKKVYSLFKAVNNHPKVCDFIVASKVRNISTGKIMQSKINDDVSNKNLIIFDDICDGGSTFIELAKVLKEKQANKLYLYVTHGIFSNGIETLLEYFDHIYCPNIFNEALAYHPRLTHLSIKN